MFHQKTLKNRREAKVAVGTHTHTHPSVFLNRRQYKHNTKYNCIELYIITL